VKWWDSVIPSVSVEPDFNIDMVDIGSRRSVRFLYK